MCQFSVLRISFSYHTVCCPENQRVPSEFPQYRVYSIFQNIYLRHEVDTVFVPQNASLHIHIFCSIFFLQFFSLMTLTSNHLRSVSNLPKSLLPSISHSCLDVIG